MCWISCHPSIMAVFWMRSLATSLWCWFCPLGLQQPIKAQRKRYSTTSQFCGHFYFRVKSSFPVLFTWIIALIWVSHCADFTESSFQNKAVDVVKKWWRENVNELLWFELVRTSPLPPPPQILLIGLGNLMRLFWFRLIKVFPRIQFWGLLYLWCLFVCF